MPDRPQTVEQLNRQLADTIGASVEALMGQSQWVEANNSLVDPRTATRQPEAPPVVNNGQTETPTNPTGQPQTITPATPQSVTDLSIFDQFKGANGKYIDKYNSVEEFIKGIGHAMTMTKQALSDNDVLRHQIDELRRTPTTPVVPVVPQDTSTSAPPRGDKTAKFSPKLGEVLTSLSNGTPLDDAGLLNLVDAISEHATEVARQTARAEAEEKEKALRANQERWDKVDDYMFTKYPDSQKFTNELGVFTKADSNISRVVAALIKEDMHEQAMEYAWTAFVAAHGIDGKKDIPFVPAPATPENIAKEAKLQVADEVRNQLKEEALKDAGVMTSMAGGAHGVHETTNLGPSRDELETAAALMRQGHGEKWRSLVFKDILDHPIFNG